MKQWVRHQVVNIGLAVAALVLVGAVIATASSVTTNEREARAFNLLAAWREDDIRRISLTKPNEKLVLVRKSGGGDAGADGWLMKEPFDEEAEVFAMDKLLGTLQYASWTRRVKPDEVDRAAFGLDNPRLVVEIEMGDITYRLRLGKNAASPPGSAYMEITGEGAPKKGVVIVGKSLIEELDMKPEDFRGRYVVPYLSPTLERIILEGAGGDRRFKRTPWDGWRFDGMENNARLARPALDRLIVQFARTVDGFIDPKKAADAQKNSTEIVTVTMFPKDKKLPKGVTRVGGQCPTNEADIVARRVEPDEVAGCAPKSMLVGLTIPSEALVDRSLFWMRRDAVETLEVHEGNRHLVMDRKEEGFVLRKPEQADVDAEAGNARLDALLGATGRIVENPNLSALGLDKPYGHVIITSAAAHEAQVQKERVDFTKIDATGHAFARREQDGIVIELARDAARSLHADASLVRSREIFDIPIDAMRRVEIDGEYEQVMTRSEKGALTLVDPKSYAGDAGLMSEAMDALRTLTADRWVADIADESFGLQSPVLKARFSEKQSAEEVSHEVVVGRPAPSGYYASLIGDAGVFVLPRRVYEVLTTLALDRSVFMLDPTIAISVELETPERRYQLERHGEQFVQSGGDEQLSDATLRALIDGLSVLRAEAAVSLGPATKQTGLDRPLLSVTVRHEAGLGERSRPTHWKVGSGDSWRGISVHYARTDDVDATYVVPRSMVQELIDRL